MRANRTWCLLLLLGLSTVARAQGLRDFAYADSLSLLLSGQGRWLALDSLGRAALQMGTDYPALRQRLGYAALQLGRPGLALRHYGAAVRANPTDEESRSQLALGYLQLLQPGAARLAVRPLPDSVRQALHLPARRALTQVALEASVRPSTSLRRSVAGYGRLTVSSQLSTRLTLTQLLAYYGQQVRFPERRLPTEYTIHQTEYAALLSEQLSLGWQLKGAYHFISNDIGQAYYANHLGYGALRYSGAAGSVQAGVYLGRITDTTRVQTDVQGLLYLSSTAKAYVYGRASLIRSGGRTFPNGLLGAGTQLHPRLSLEAYASPGRMPVLFERDGADVYNVLDSLRFRWGTNAYWQLTGHWRLQLSYLAARYQEIRVLSTYSQHSLTGGLVWTW